MRACLNPFSFLVVSLAGWLNQRQHQIIHYLVEENCVLREQMGRRRLRFTDDQRRRLAAKAKTLGRKVLAQVATIVTPETLLGVASEIDCQEGTTAAPSELRAGHRRRPKFRISFC